MTYTYLDTPDGLRIAAPNSSISAGKITNYTALGTRRIEHAVSASYDAPVQTVRQALLDAVARTPGLLDKPAPEVYVNAYGESGIEYIVRAWARTADYWPAYYALLEGIKTAFDQRSVEMPYNHLNVHIVDPVRVERETKHYLFLLILVGALIGWIAGKLMGSRGGLIRNLILGVVGSAVGNWLAGTIGIAATGSVGAILIGVGGACVVILIARWLFH